jgi:hypothetical protein
MDAAETVGSRGWIDEQRHHGLTDCYFSRYHILIAIIQVTRYCYHEQQA